MADLADTVYHQAVHAAEIPEWVPEDNQLTSGNLGDLAVWRAATDTHPQDRRPTGEPQLSTDAVWWQQHLEQQIGYATKDQHSGKPTETHGPDRRWPTPKPSYPDGSITGPNR